jgi:putative DNA primase/helicase
MFCLNELPKTNDTSNGYFRRFLIAPFPVEIPKNKIDPKLASKIISSELPGIMNWVLQGRERLLKQNAFTESRVMANALDDYKSKYTKKVTSRIKLLLPPYL